MSAWGTDAFENDDAAEWSYMLEERGFPFLEKTLNAVIAVGHGELDADVASAGIAASDTVARLRGQYGKQDENTETVDSWVLGQSREPTPELVQKALEVVTRVMGPNSELADVWAESEDELEWRGQLKALRARLQA